MSENDLQSIANNILNVEDYELESTTQSLNQFNKLIKTINLQKNASNILDIGCGTGGFTKVLQSYFELDTAYGIDKNKELLDKANEKGLQTYELDIINSRLPFDDDSIDIISCLGVLEHLPEHDFILKEIKRILKKDGFVIFALPNLSSWVNRLSLLGGWQPRNSEISTQTVVNSPPWYNGDDEILYHNTTPTYNGFYELLEYYDYNILSSEPLFPYQRNKVTKIIDYLTRYKISFARRFCIVAQKT